MSKRPLDSVISASSKRQRNTIAQKFECIFPIPNWLKGTDGRGTVAFITYGRYQPAHLGHKAVFDKLVSMAIEDKNTRGYANSDWNGSDGSPASNVFVFASPTVDKQRPPTNSTRKRVTSVRPSRYPLPPDLKVRLMEEQTSLYQNPEINIINMAASKNQVDGRRDPAAAIKLILACYDHVIMLVGSDRVNDFSWLGMDPRVTIMSAGQRDDNVEGVMGMSGTKVRAAVMRGDIETAKKGMSYGAVTDKTLDAVIETLQSAMANKGGKYKKRKTAVKKNKRRATRKRH